MPLWRGLLSAVMPRSLAFAFISVPLLFLIAVVLPMTGTAQEFIPAPRRELAPAGRGEPQAAAPAQSIIIDWDMYRTMIVIESGGGIRRQAWVVTYDRASSQMVVCYTGIAFMAGDHRLHIDCRDAVLDRGIHADQWSPDSFAVNDDDTVDIVDDRLNSMAGVLIRRIFPHQREEFRQALSVSRYEVCGIL